MLRSWIPKGLAFLHTIRQATTQMNQLIEDLLSYSRLERRTLTVAKVDLKHLVEQIFMNENWILRRKISKSNGCTRQLCEN